MKLFGGKKKQKDIGPEIKEKPTEDVPRDRPFAAHVTRTKPTEIDGTILKGEIKTGGFKDLFTYSDMKEFVKQIAGGGDFIASVRDQDEGVIIDTYKFTLAGEPKVDGAPVVRDSKPGKKTQQEEESVVERNNREMAEMKSDAEKKKLAKKIADDFGEDNPEDNEAVTRQDSSEKESLLAVIEEMREERDRDREEREREKEERRLEKEVEKKEREKKESEEKMDALTATVNELKAQLLLSQANKPDLVAEMMKQSQDSMTKMFTMLMSRSDESSKQALAQVVRLSEVRDGQSDKQTDMLHKTWLSAKKTFDDREARDAEIALVAAQAGASEEPEAKGPWDTFSHMANKVLDMVSAKMALEQENGETITPERLEQIKTEALEKVKQEQASLPAPGTPLPSHPVQPRKPSEQSRPVTPSVVAPGGKDIRQVARARLKVQMDRVMQIAIAEIREYGLVENGSQWMKAARNLPGEIQVQLGACKGDLNKLIGVLGTYGSKALAGKLAETIQAEHKAAQPEAQEKELAEPPADVPAAPPAAPSPPPAAPSPPEETEEEKKPEPEKPSKPKTKKKKSRKVKKEEAKAKAEKEEAAATAEGDKQ